MARLWFTSVLRDGLALAAAGSIDTFAHIGAETLRGLVANLSIDRDIDAAIDHVLEGFMALRSTPTSPAAFGPCGLPACAWSPCPTAPPPSADALLGSAGLRAEFERLLSVEDAGAWKPAPGAYQYAGRMCGTALADMVLVAVHPWDIDGAARAGMATAWLNRTGLPYPGHFTPPAHTIESLEELAGVLTR